MNNHDFNSKCGKGRGCRIAVLPIDDLPNSINGCIERSLIRVYRLSDGRTPNWKVVRWDIEETTSQHCQAAG
jgi:hypothetical protein